HATHRLAAVDVVHLEVVVADMPDRHGDAGVFHVLRIFQHDLLVHRGGNGGLANAQNAHGITELFHIALVLAVAVLGKNELALQFPVDRLRPDGGKKILICHSSSFTSSASCCAGSCHSS